MTKNNSSNARLSPIKAGTTILTEKPFAYILSYKEQRLRCDHCFAKGKVLKCSGCQVIHYCGRICQKDAWPEHKAECAGYRRVAPRMPPDAARLMARVVRRLANGGAFQRGHYTKKNYRVWKDLMSHYHDLKVDSRRMEHFTSLCAVLFEFLTDVTLPNSAELMGIYGRMCVNGFSILCPEMLSVGTGIYLGCSILDHSCEPNAVAVFEGTTLHIRTLVDMPSLDFSKIFISYIDLLNSPFDRQTELQMTYYFLCQCERCLDDHQISLMHAAQCPNLRCDYPVQIPWKEDVKLVIRAEEGENNPHYTNQEHTTNGWSKNGDEFQKQVEESRGKSRHNRNCFNQNRQKSYAGNNDYLDSFELVDEKLSNGFRQLSIDKSNSNGYHNDNGYALECPKCNTTISEEFVKKFKEIMEFTTVHLQNMKNKSMAYVDVCRACIDKQRGVLHPLSLLYIQTLDLAMDGCLQYEFWEQARVYAKQLIPGFKNYYGEKHPLYGLLLVKLGKLELFSGRPQEALMSLGQAADVLRITHGTRHQLWVESLVPLLRQAESETSGVMSF